MFIKIKVSPSAKHETVKKISADRYLISVKEPAERNLANGRIRQIIAEIYGLNSKAVRIISGHQSLTKIVSINIETE